MKLTTNVFTDGLIMDLNPLVTPKNVLTNCLNGTLVTFNGNENALLNDMGNGRVETAQLPEGYVPIGTCSYGGIIYIVSYNPLTNKSQIGSFPSPERNIDSTELYPLKSDSELNINELIDNGNIKTYSLKKELLDKINPGDKFIVFSNNLDGKYLSDYGNTDHTDGGFPKLWKLQIALLEDSGKVTVLDNVKWYDGDFHILEKNDIFDVNNDVTNVDIDEYRSLVNSAYSILNSKKSGKLILLVSPETIDDFNCTWTVLDVNESDNSFNIGLDFNWNTSNNNINISRIEIKETSGKNHIKNLKDLEISRVYHPEGKKEEEGEIKVVTYKEFKSLDTNSKLSIDNKKNELNPWINTTPDNIEISNLIRVRYINNITESLILDRISDSEYVINCTHVDEDGNYYSENEGNFIELSPQTIEDDVVNNIIKKNIIKKIGEITIDDNNKNDIITLEITPCMPYGILDYLKQTLTIDLSKINNKVINVNKWRYYTYTNTLMLNWGMEAYTEPNRVISGIDMEFYDNSGKAAVYHVQNKSSYNGEFINYINLNDNSNYYNIDGFDINSEGEKLIFFHPKNDTVLKQNQLLEEGTYFYFKKWDTESNQLIPVTSEDDLKDWKNLTHVLYDKESFDKIENNSNILLLENDSGVIYDSALYLVKIIIKYASINSFGQIEEMPKDNVIEYRWLWTNGIFNEKYDQVDDFISLNPKLVFDIDLKFGVNQNFKIDRTKSVNNGCTITDNPITEIEVSDNVQEIKSTEPNVNARLGVFFQNNYGTFQIFDGEKKIGETTEDILEHIKINAFLYGESKYNTDYQVIYEKDDGNGNLIIPKIKEEENNNEENNEESKKEDKKENYASLTFNGTTKSNLDLTFVNINGDLINTKDIDLNVYKGNYRDFYSNNKTLDFTFEAEHHSKYYTVDNGSEPFTGRKLKPFILSIGDLSKCNLDIVKNDDSRYNGKLYCKTLIGIGKSHRDANRVKRYEIILSVYDIENDLTLLQTYRFKDDPKDNKILYNSLTQTFDSFNGTEVIKSEIQFPLIPILPGPCVSTENWDGHITILKDYIDNSSNIAGNDAFNTGKKNIFISDRKETDNLTQITNDEASKFGGFLSVISNEGMLIDFDRPVSSKYNFEYTPNYNVDCQARNPNLIADSGNYDFEIVNRKDAVNTTAVDTTIVTYFAPYIFSLLIQSYYLSNDSESLNKYISDNYVYLSDNSFMYENNLIVLCKVDSDFESNNILLMKGIDYLEYLKDVLGNVNDNSIDKTNTEIKILDITRTFPILFKLDYIQPELERVDRLNSVIVLTVAGAEYYKNVPNFVNNWEYDDEQIVIWDYVLKKFVKLNGSTHLMLYEPFSEENLTKFFKGELDLQVKEGESPVTFTISDNLANQLYNNNGYLYVKDYIDMYKTTSVSRLWFGTHVTSIAAKDCIKIFNGGRNKQFYQQQMDTLV